MGKSTAIKRIINQIGAEHFGGFYTEEIRDLTNRIGFKCVTLNGESVRFASVDSESAVRVGRYGVEIDAFENLALKAVSQSLDTKRITVIDEIGFMQMLSARFQEMIREVFSRSQPIILGTICVDSHPEIDRVKALPGIKLYTLHEHNRDSAIEAVAHEIVKRLG